MQSIPYLMMIRPFRFGSNEQTAVNNFYQQNSAAEMAKSVAEQALQEFDAAVNLLRRAHIPVWVLHDSEVPAKPDSVFPNNWISTHEDGTVVLYPMFASNRRVERRPHIGEELLLNGFSWKKLLDFSHFEQNEKFLEGTGSMVLDRMHRVVYAVRSERTDEELIERWCAAMHYTAVVFDAYQHLGGEKKPVYHTNVVMSVGETLAIVALEMIPQEQRDAVVASLSRAGKEILEITEAQVNQFCGNALEVRTAEGERIWVMSHSAWQGFTDAQKALLSTTQSPVVLHIPTIESVGGGSARCMLAEIFLPKESRI